MVTVVETDTGQYRQVQVSVETGTSECSNSRQIQVGVNRTDRYRSVW